VSPDREREVLVSVRQAEGDLPRGDTDRETGGPRYLLGRRRIAIVKHATEKRSEMSFPGFTDERSLYKPVEPHRAERWREGRTRLLGSVVPQQFTGIGDPRCPLGRYYCFWFDGHIQCRCVLPS
jgi:hypothetical protein